MTTKPKSQAGVIAGNMLINDLVHQSTGGSGNRLYPEKELAEAVNAVETDKDYIDYDNRLQVRNFLLDMISRGRLALVEIRRNSHILSELCIRLQASIKLDLVGEQEYYTQKDYQKATKTKLESYYKGDDGELRTTTLLPFALDYLTHHPEQYIKGKGKALDNNEIAYFRDIVGLEITDKGIVSATKDDDLRRFQHSLHHNISDDKEKLRKICAYWQDPNIISTGEKYTYTKDELLIHLEPYIEYLRNKGDTNAIKSTLHEFWNDIQDSVAHIQEKPLQTEIKRLSALELATKEYHAQELAEYYGADFTAQAWGDKHIIITPDGNIENTSNEILKTILELERTQKINFATALETMEAHLEFCRGYNLMIELLREYTGAEQMARLIIDTDELEAGIKACYTLIEILAEQCLSTERSDIKAKTSKESQIKVEIIRNAIIKTNQLKTQSKSTFDERKQELRKMLALDNKKAKPVLFNQIQNEFFAVAMGVYYKWN